MIGQFNIYIYMLIPVLLPYFKKIRVNLRGFANLGEENKITNNKKSLNNRLSF